MKKDPAWLFSKKVQKNLVYKINYFIFASEFNPGPVRNGTEQNPNGHSNLHSAWRRTG